MHTFDYATEAGLFGYSTEAELFSTKGKKSRRQPLGYNDEKQAKVLGEVHARIPMVPDEGGF